MLLGPNGKTIIFQQPNAEPQPSLVMAQEGSIGLLTTPSTREIEAIVDSAATGEASLRLAATRNTQGILQTAITTHQGFINEMPRLGRVVNPNEETLLIGSSAKERR